jgi:predicted HicB family RNase H-like nuclease
MSAHSESQETRVQVMVRFPKPLYKALCHRAVDAELSWNALMVRLIEEYLPDARP